MKKLILLITMMCSLSLTAGEWSGNTKVKKIYPHSQNNTDGTIYLTFDVMKKPDNCTRDTLLALKKSNKVSSEIYSLVLTAATSNKELNYWTGGCDAHGYPVLLHATLLF